MEFCKKGDTLLMLYESHSVWRGPYHCEIIITGKTTFGPVRAMLTCKRAECEPKLNLLIPGCKYLLYFRNLFFKESDDFYVNVPSEPWDNFFLQVIHPIWTVWNDIPTLQVVQEASLYPPGLSSTKKKCVWPLTLEDHYALSDLKLPELPDYEYPF